MQMRLGLGLHVDRCLDRHMPIRRRAGVLVMAWAKVGPLRELARQRLRLGQDVVGDAVEEAPALAFLGAHRCGR